jgi:hypothetical protein
MISLIFGSFLTIVGFALSWVPTNNAYRQIKALAVSGVMVVGILIALSGAFGYNDAGYCQHTRTIFGTETSQCTTGWYALLWGTSTQWPHFITVANTNDFDAGGSAVSGPYSVRLADNWNGGVTQATRFGIPQDSEQFLAMAKTFRSPERLITTTLRPAVTASLDSVANLFTMEEYYAGGQRDAFKTEYERAIKEGRAQVRQVQNFNSNFGINNPNSAAANDLEFTDDGDSVGDLQQRRVVMEKVLDASGNEIRVAHAYIQKVIRYSKKYIEWRGIDKHNITTIYMGSAYESMINHLKEKLNSLTESQFVEYIIGEYMVEQDKKEQSKNDKFGGKMASPKLVEKLKKIHKDYQASKKK